MLTVTHFGPVTRFDLARTLAGKGRYWTTAHLLDGHLIDTGCAFSSPELLAYLEDIPLQRILNTHTHEDHIGANGQLQRQRPGLEILAHPLSLPILADPRRTQPLHPYRRVMWGWPSPSSASPVADGSVIETDSYSFQVIYTPGHARDHICFYEPRQGWIFSGDLFVGGRDRGLRLDCDIWQIIASLKRISGLPAETLYPGSARVRTDPASDLADKIAYLEDFGSRVLDLHANGHSERDIVKKLCGQPMLIEFITLGHFSRRNLVRSYLGINQDPPQLLLQ